MRVMDDDAKYRALVAHDARFDGVFFVGVTTTGIYCRPVCRARTPGRDRCVFFRSAALAERAGFRACFRCRPELAPGIASVDAVSTLARTASARIEAGALNDASLDDLARDLGVSSRHVRRALQREVGVSPAELAETARLALAKQLLHDEPMTMTSIAYASGFSSVRRFNAAFRARFDRAPSSLQKRKAEPAHGTIALTLGHRAPIAWSALLEFLAVRATPGVEHVDLDAMTYARTVDLDSRRGFIVARRHASRDAIVVEATAPLARSLMTIASRARRLFDLDAEPHAIERHLARDVALRPLVKRSPGLRVPGAWDGFEIAARAVLGQQISVRAATTLAGRFARAFGDTIETPHADLAVAFPTAAAVAGASHAAIRAIGVTDVRARTLAALAESFAKGRIALDGDPKAAREALESIDGIGPWTTEYVAMRAMRAPDAFPHGDLVLARALSLAPRALRDRSAAWSPWRAYAAMHLWRKGNET
jgi:AraC family transcriptional regulator of adaptative response / DNA-3-methyladenine glycosylase II